MSYVFSFDNLVVSKFLTTASVNTLPVYLYGSLQYGPSPAVYAAAAAEFSEKELLYLTSAIASINVWNRFGAGYRWTPAARQKAVHVAAS